MGLYATAQDFEFNSAPPVLTFVILLPNCPHARGIRSLSRIFPLACLREANVFNPVAKCLTLATFACQMMSKRFQKARRP